MSDDEFMTPAEVAAYFKVDPKTVQRWDKAKKLRSFRTLGGHRRFYRSQVTALADKGASDDADSEGVAS